ncbi:MAG: transcription antitermination factor NusB [Spirochaetia bacterium]|nr:transcription antitermination protein NusB [Spirochaetota bacterium]MCX8097230.1 transcription antitermination protein NusB [Spirochaetota bacterium]MDW8111984.1 transcription antitermination factor NusB [Spirochaetia bacterium]
MKFDKTISREIALHGIYQHIMGLEPENIVKFEWVEGVFEGEIEYRNKDFILTYARKILNTYFSRHEQIINILNKFYVKNPELLSSIDKALLMLGITMYIMGDNTPKVVIDEIINISKSYGSTNNTYKMINKFMDLVVKNQSIL